MQSYACRNGCRLAAVALLAGALSAAPALAQGQAAAAPEGEAGWTDFVRTDELGVQFDTARLERRTDGALLVWVRFEYSDTEPVPGRPGARFSTLEIREAIDCDRQRVQDLRVVMRDRSERVVGEEPVNGSGWKTFPEHPFDATLFVLACRYLTPRATGLAYRGR